MDSFTLETDVQEKISVDELASLIFKILKRNLSTKKRITSYYPGSLASIRGFELLRYPGGNEVKVHPDFDKKYAQAVHILRDKGLIMQDHTQGHSSEFVELTPKGESAEPEQFLPLVESYDKLLQEIESSFGPIDSVAKIYLKEALGTFKSDYLISAAFCLGAMSERCILLFSNALEADLKDVNATAEYSKCKSVKQHAKFVVDNLLKLRKKYPGNDDLFFELDTKINSLASHYRLTRNEAGHPDFVPKIERAELELALKTVSKYLGTVLSVLKLLGAKEYSVK
jgi:hypothetical protein